MSPDGTKLMKCIECYDDDEPFIWYFIYTDTHNLQTKKRMVYHVIISPIDGYSVKKLSEDKAEKLIAEFRHHKLSEYLDRNN